MLSAMYTRDPVRLRILPGVTQDGNTLGEWNWEIVFVSETQRRSVVLCRVRNPTERTDVPWGVSTVEVSDVTFFGDDRNFLGGTVVSQILSTVGILDSCRGPTVGRSYVSGVRMSTFLDLRSVVGTLDPSL